MKAAEFKEDFKGYISIEDYKYLFTPDELKEYHELICEEMKQKIAKEWGIIDINETEDIEF